MTSDITLCCRPFCGEPACEEPNAEREFLCETCMDEWLRQRDGESDFPDEHPFLRLARAM